MEAWLNPWADPSGRSFQIIQSLLAVANGGLFGRGPGLGNPGLVPVVHSDLIYAAITEEHGLIGGLVLLLLIALFVSRGLRAALSAQDHYRRYLATGLVAFAAGQSLLIIGGSLRLLPLTGITLPFVSYGGSSLVTSFILLLLLLLISQRSETPPAALPSAAPYLQLAVFLWAGLALAALGTAWWSIYRGTALLARTDNPRRAINDRYVQRGAILDRDGQVINISLGAPGELARQNRYPALSNVVGYTDPVYGQTGLEASLDDYLRGLKGNPGVLIAWEHLLYGQPPAGLDIRLSLSLELQQLADQLLQGHSGALVALNAGSGEILAMASAPTFDANALAENWDQLVQEVRSPLLNRAALGRYPPGDLEGQLFQAGLPALKVAPSPLFELPTGDLPADPNLLAGYSPLQLALAASVLSAAGVRPAPQMVLAVNTPTAGWALLPARDLPRQVMAAEVAQQLAQANAVKRLNIWQRVAVAAPATGEAVTWFLGGTLPGWGGAPYALALVLEEQNPNQAIRSGQALLQAIMYP